MDSNHQDSLAEVSKVDKCVMKLNSRLVEKKMKIDLLEETLIILEVMKTVKVLTKDSNNLGVVNVLTEIKILVMKMKIMKRSIIKEGKYIISQTKRST